MPTTYNPQARVAKFTEEYGTMGHMVLDCFNTINPLSCYFGDDCNPDEYLGYAERFIKSYAETEFVLNDSRRDQTLPELIRELARRAFGPTQVVEGWVSLVQIDELAEKLIEGLKQETQTR